MINVNLIFSHLQELIDNQPTIFLDDVGQETLIKFILENESGINQLTIEEQKSFFRLCMNHFGAFATIALNCLPALSPLLKYAFISKALYEFGACGAPEDIASNLKEFLQSEPREWFTSIETENHIFNLREALLSIPDIGVEPLLEEFPSCPDIDLLMAMLANPIVPRELVESIVKREHFIFDENEESDLDDLVELAEGVLSR